MANRIEKQIELKAPIGRVWRALANSREFGEWFGVALEQPFAPGETVRGHVLHPGYEHVLWEATIERMEPERLLSFTWAHVRSFDKASYSPDYSNQPRTLVEFRLEPTPAGTLLVVTESGFENLPAGWRDEALERNDGGWTQQVKNIEAYVAEKA